MLKRALGLVITAVMLLGVFCLTGCYDNNTAEPFTQEQILSYLNDKYDEEFVFVKNEFDSNQNKFSKFVYCYSPKDSQHLEFYVVDKIIQANRISHWDRILNDTYPHSLLQADFQNIESICGQLMIDMPSFEELWEHLRYSNKDNPPYFVHLSVKGDIEFDDEFAQQLYHVGSYFKENLEKYKSNNMYLYVYVLATQVSLYYDDAVCSLESIISELSDITT